MVVEALVSGAQSPLRDRYRTALALIVRSDINRTLADAGQLPTQVDVQHTDQLTADWRLLRRYSHLGVEIAP